MFKLNKHRSASLKVLVIATLSLSSVFAVAQEKEGGVILSIWDVIFFSSTSGPSSKEAR